MTNLFLGLPDVPEKATRIDTNGSFGANTPIYNLIAGERYQIAKLSAATSDLTRINFDLGSVTRAANYVAIARADLLKAANVGRVVVRGSTQSAFTPSNISGLRGWWDFTRGVTVSTGISQVNDQSGVGAHMAQGTGANQPILTRGDNLENRAKYSEDLSQAAFWTGNRSTIQVGTTVVSSGVTIQFLKEDATAANRHQLESQTFPTVNGQVYNFKLRVKSTNRGIAIRPLTGFAGNFVYFDAVAGAVVSTPADVSNATITALDNGTYQISFDCTANATSSSATVNYYLTNASNSTTTIYNGDNTSGCYIGAIQIRHSSADNTYLATTSAQLYAGLNDNKVATFDGVNDQLSVSGTNMAVTGAFTAAVAFKFAASTGDSYVFGNGNSGATHFYFSIYSDNKLYFYVGDNTNYTTGQALTPGSTYIAIATWDGTTGANSMKLYLNSASVTVQKASTKTPSNTTTYLLGGASLNSCTIGEAVLYNNVISGSDLTSLHAYLTTKWQTAAVTKNNTLSSQTLYGFNSKDYYTTFSTSTAYRHWWIDYENSASGSLEHSKLFLGSYFDFGVDPDDIAISKIEPREIKEYSTSGAIQFVKNEQSKYRFDITWLGLTDDVIKDFCVNVASKSYRKKGLYLFTTTDHTVLDNQRIVYCQLTDFRSESSKTDWNTLTATFEEIIG